MEIKDLQPGQGSVNIEATVKSMEETKSFEKYGKQLRVANAMIADESGEIKLTLWNEDIDKVKVGSIVKITNGYVNEFSGEKQLTSGKFGKLEVDGEGSENSESTEDASSEKEPEEASEASEPESVPETENSEDSSNEVQDY